MFKIYLFLIITILSNYLHPLGKLYHQEYPKKLEVFIINDYEEYLINFIQEAISKSESFISKIPEKMLVFGGHMTSPRSRHLLNNICALKDIRYLEIGSHKGASLICALYKNDINYAYTIDNWSEFGQQTNELNNNINKYIPKYPVTILNLDAFTINTSSLPKFNIYFYDGSHDLIAQEKAFIHFNECLDDIFIAIVDDWNHEQVRKGTFNAFNKLNYHVLFEKEIALRFKNDIPWRFIYVSVIKKVNICTKQKNHHFN